MTAYTIEFEPIGRKGQCQDNESILDCARQLGIGINNICGGQGICGTCKIQIVTGTTSQPTSQEQEVFSHDELDNGWRLACQVYPLSDCKLNIPAESMTTSQRTQVDSIEITVPPEPPVLPYEVHLPSNVTPDSDRLLQALKEQHSLQCQSVDVDAISTLASSLQAWNWNCQASVRNDEVIAIGLWPSKHLGLAIDLGTTKIAAFLIDLNSGHTLASKGIMNPQISYGEDIITRINGALKSQEKALHMQKLVTESFNQVAVELCDKAGANVEEIVEVVVVGNTAMHHLFAGLPVEQLALSPFVPAVSEAMDIKARDVGLHIAIGAYVHLLPNIAGYIGGDHVAMLLATRALQKEEPALALDIGTNTEVSLIADNKITAVSCASGPAFEGYYIKHGMRAAGGAIEKVRIENDTVSYQTIDHLPPVGICGSGVLDALAQLYLAGIIDKGGRMKDGHSRIHTRDKLREFTLVNGKEGEEQNEIVISQKDVREIQLAKSAIRTGIQVLLSTNGIHEEDIKKVIIAGAFGTYIDISSAITINMLPDIPLERFQQVGNAAGLGARLALISLTERKKAQQIASDVNYVELANAPDFTKIFIESGYFGK